MAIYSKYECKIDTKYQGILSKDKLICNQGSDSSLCYLYKPFADKLLQMKIDFHDQYGFYPQNTSGYRSDKHNDRIGGADNSYHKIGLAADYRIYNLTDAQKNYLSKKAQELNLFVIQKIDHYHIDGRFIADDHIKASFPFLWQDGNDKVLSSIHLSEYDFRDNICNTPTIEIINNDVTIINENITSINQKIDQYISISSDNSNRIDNDLFYLKIGVISSVVLMAIIIVFLIWNKLKKKDN